MDLTGMIQNPVEDQNSEQKLSKEEYAALKKQEREETWMQIDGQAQSVFKDGAVSYTHLTLPTNSRV